MSEALTTGRDLEAIEKVEVQLLRLPQIHCPLQHLFAPGVYLREIFMPAETIVIGQQHQTEHFNIVLSGRAKVMIDGVTREIVAPCIFVSKPGVRKLLYIKEDMRWVTVHPTNETDVEKLEDMLVVKSGSYLDYEKEIKQLRDGGVE